MSHCAETGAGSTDSTRSLRRCRWLAAASVCLLLLSTYLLTHGGEFYVADGLIMYRTTESLATRHSIVIEPMAEHRFQVLQGQQGFYFSKYGLGQPLLSLIPYRLGSAVENSILKHDLSEVSPMYFVSLMNQIVTAVTGGLIVLLGMRLGYGIRLSVALALAWGLTTLAWPYSKMYFSEPLFTVCLVAATLGLLAYQQSPGRERFAWLALAGFALGYGVLTRVSGVTFVPLFLLYGIWAASGHPEGQPVRRVIGRLRGHRGASALESDMRRWRAPLAIAAVSFGIPFAACVGLLLWHNVARFGHPFDNGYSEEAFSAPLLTGLAGILISPGKGLFLYVPLTILTAVAWPWFWRHQRATAALFGSVAMMALVQTAKWWAWWGGASWGPRLLIPLLPFAILALGPLLQQARWSRVAAIPLAAAGLAVTLAGVLVNFNQPLNELQTRFVLASDRPPEPAMYFKPDFSPILAHARYIWERQHLSVVTFDLERLGFAAGFQLLFLLAIGTLFVAAVLMLAHVHRELRRMDR